VTTSTQTAPRQLSFGRFPTAFAALAMVAILALVIALVALNAAKAPATVTTGAKGAPPPAVIDHGWSNGETSRILATRSGSESFGGWNGPRLVVSNIHGRGWTGPALRPN
jgi:hypothetical protein